MEFDTKQGYLHDILLQPDALTNTYNYLLSSFSLGEIPSKIKSGKYSRIILTGMGSSHFIFYPLYYELVQQSIPVTIIEGAELINFADNLIQRDSLIITASQSGNSAETVHLLEINQSRGATILGITNTADSKLAKGANVVVLTQAGTEATVSCKTYVSALMAIRWIQDALFEKDLSLAKQETAEVSSLVNSYIDHWMDHVEYIKKELAENTNFFICSRGPSLAAVFTGSLTGKESTTKHVEGLSCPALRHGPKEMMVDGTYVMMFAGPKKTQELNRTLASELEQQGAKVAWVGSDSVIPAYHLPACPDSLLPILEILPTEMFNLALADLNNHVAGTFSHASKITNKE
jgi:glucosamine--fructose-6-phosphate aminotransferase (isomerizing)